MAKVELAIAAATWTNIGSFVAAVSPHVNVYADRAIQLGRKATAPTAGVAVAAKESIEVLLKTGDTLQPWVYCTEACKVYIDEAGGRKLSIDGTGTT